MEKVPLDALHVEPEALPPMIPANVTLPPAQTVWALPVLAVAAGFTKISTVDVAAVHIPAPSGSSVVNVNVTDPLEITGV